MIPHCARPTRAFFLSLLKSRMERIRKEISYLQCPKGWPAWFPTARIERPPLYRGGSASNGNLPGYPVFFCGSSNFSPFLNTP